MKIREFADADADEVVALWRRCGLTRPWNDPHKDIARKRAVQPDLFLVAELDGAIVGSVMGGYDGHRGWVYYLAADESRRRSGLGRALMAEVEARLRRLGCAKINLQVRSDNPSVLDFYAKLGFVRDESVSLGKRLERDDA
jgi:ribosomal protein S18 acetylase RimI-like enzyme